MLKIKDWISTQKCPIGYSDIIYVIEKENNEYLESFTYTIVWTKSFISAHKFFSKFDAIEIMFMYQTYTKHKLKVTEHMYM